MAVLKGWKGERKRRRRRRMKEERKKGKEDKRERERERKCDARWRWRWHANCYRRLWAFCLCWNCTGWSADSHWAGCWRHAGWFLLDGGAWAGPRDGPGEEGAERTRSRWAPQPPRRSAGRSKVSRGGCTTMTELLATALEGTVRPTTCWD